MLVELFVVVEVDVVIYYIDIVGFDKFLFLVDGNILLCIFYGY